jgi:tetratricopeptide (TPR) repeat protein
MRFLIVCILVLATAFVSMGQTLPNTKPIAKASSKSFLNSESAEYQKLRREGFNALYNMDYKNAQAKFNQMTQILPEHPAGHFYLATNYWLELLESTRRLQSNLYGGESFYADTQDKVDEKIDKEFRRLLKVSLERAESNLKKNPKDVESIYYQGAAHGLMASYEATVSRAFFSALKHGSKSVDLHRKVVELDPNYVDAYLTIGTYDYIVGSLPFAVKIVAAIGGFRGSKERGLQELNLVAQKGFYAQDDAKVLLLTLYNRENKNTEVLHLLETLSNKYPQNYLFKVERANTLVKLNRATESYQLFEELLKTKSAQKMQDLIHYQYGEAFSSQGRYADALNEFQKVKSLNASSSELVTRAHLRAGQILDLLAKRDEAKLEYQTVLKRENVFDSHEQAKKYLQKPYNVKGS